MMWSRSFPEPNQDVPMLDMADTKWGTRRYLDMNRLAETSEAA
jgi:hypothetical protein